MIIHQHQAARGDTAFDPFESPVAGKSVLRHRETLSVVTQLVITQPPDDGKQHGRLARPDRLRRPQIVTPAAVLQSAKFRAVGLDAANNSGRGNGMLIVAHGHKASILGSSNTRLHGTWR